MTTHQCGDCGAGPTDMTTHRCPPTTKPPLLTRDERLAATVDDLESKAAQTTTLPEPVWPGGLVVHDHSIECDGCRRRHAQLAELHAQVGRLRRGNLQHIEDGLGCSDVLIEALERADRLQAIVTAAALETYTPDGSERVVAAFHEVLTERNRLAAMLARVEALPTKWQRILDTLLAPQRTPGTSNVRAFVESATEDVHAALSGPSWATDPETSDVRLISDGEPR